MGVVGQEFVKSFCIEPQVEFMLVGIPKPSSNRVFRTSGDETSSGCNFNVITESLRNTNELDHVSFVFLLCIDP